MARASAASRPFLSTIWAHYIHLPHPAMPARYAAAIQSGDPDYVGTLEQWDAWMGAILGVLDSHGVREDTLVWITSDNGQCSSGCVGLIFSEQVAMVRSLRAAPSLHLFRPRPVAVRRVCRWVRAPADGLHRRRRVRRNPGLLRGGEVLLQQARLGDVPAVLEHLPAGDGVLGRNRRGLHGLQARVQGAGDMPKGGLGLIFSRQA